MYFNVVLKQTTKNHKFLKDFMVIQVCENKTTTEVNVSNYSVFTNLYQSAMCKTSSDFPKYTLAFFVLSRKLALLLTLTTKRKICQVHPHTPKPFRNKQETVL